MRSGIGLGKADHDSRIGTAKGIDALIIIPDNKEIRILSCQNPDAFKLLLIDILKLVHKEKGKPLLPERAKACILLQELNAFGNHVIEVKKRILLKICLIIGKQSRKRQGFSFCGRR